MRRAFSFVLVCVVTLSFAARAAFGWGHDGHRVVGAIAASYLTDPVTKQAIQDLLGAETLADAATWADEIRGDSQYNWVKPLHYINVSRAAITVDLTAQCGTGNCVVAAITTYADVLRDSSRSQAERLEALKLLVHFVGDVHQPLHVSYKEDLGGNRIDVKFFGDSGWSLHSVWDTGLIKRRMQSDWPGFAAQLRASVADAERQAWAQALDPVTWANESLTITRQLYTDLPQNGSVSQAYYDEYIPVVEDRLAAAGVRLAALLEDIFANGTVQPVQPESIDLFPNDSGEELRAKLHEYVMNGHQPLGYRKAREAIYWYVDNEDGTVVTIYDRAAVELPAGVWPSATTINAEHIWPQSRGAKNEPAKSDVHHLRPEIPRVNSTRGNLPFGTPVPPFDHDEGWKVGRESDGDKVFLPPPDMRGDVARSLFYFSIRYELEIDADEEEDLRLWHAEDPPGAEELARMKRAQERQGNKNPFVEDPDLVDRLDDF